MPTLDARHRVLVVDDNAGSGRTLAAIISAVGGDRPAEPRTVELHYDKFERDPANSLDSLTRMAPGLIARPPLWAYRHYTMTSGLVDLYRNHRPGEAPSTAEWWSTSHRLREDYLRTHGVAPEPRPSPELRDPCPFPEAWSRTCLAFTARRG